MPELPEVQTVVDGVYHHLINQTITAVWRSNFNLRSPYQADLSDKIVGAKFYAVKRRAKFIIAELEVDLVIHLGMSGKLLIKDSNYKPVKHDHVILSLSSGKQLVFNDPRRFGYFFWTLSAQDYLSHYGLEPLDDKFTSSYLLKYCKNKKTSIKNLIMDQRVVVGVGNIYACEALFHAKVLPTLQSKLLQSDAATQLVSSIKSILSKAINQGGTTLRDYRQANDELGYFQQQLYVYGRSNESCYSCGDEICITRQAGRSTFYCKGCQGVIDSVK
jgi:formamidopyrimidine-DNA glycosylase